MTTRKKPRTATIPDRVFRLNLRAQISLTLLACFAVFLTICVPLQGQQRPKPKDYAVIFGTVWGPDDHPVAGVKVKIRKAGEKKAHWELYSNRRGEFEQPVPKGKQAYIVWPDLKGYKSLAGKHLQSGPEVTVQIESNDRADVGLHLQ